MSLALISALALSLGASPATTDDGPAPEDAPAAAPSGPVRDDEASAVNLVWDAPAESCSDAEAMQARLDEAMKLQLDDDPRTRERWVIARVRRDGDVWTLRLWVAPKGGLSERALTDESCAELERATLTIVAMLMPPVMYEVDPTPPPQPKDIEPPPDTEPPMDEEELAALIADAPAPVDPPPDPGGPDMAPPPPSKLRGAIGFAGGFGRGNMPAGAGGLALTAALLIPDARFELVGHYMSTRSLGLDIAPNARVRYSVLSAALRGCGAPAVNKWFEIPVCGGLEAGSVLANVDGATLLHGPGQPIVLLSLETGVNLTLAPSFAIKLAAQGWGSLLRAEHRLLDSTLSRSERFGYRLWSGVEFRFGGRRKARAFER